MFLLRLIFNSLRMVGGGRGTEVGKVNNEKARQSIKDAGFLFFRRKLQTGSMAGLLMAALLAMTFHSAVATGHRATFVLHEC